MCGIAGIVGGHPDPAELAPMLEAMRHRGPDDEGTWSDTHCALGHRRLAIIDLSPGGHQPMLDPTGRLAITFNGEIYNFQELRRQLEGLGHEFHTASDTEVILAAYRQWGADCLRRFQGMFAIALWDAEQRRLFLARDRVGKKPLVYGIQDGRFYFASELQGLTAHPVIERDIDLAALDMYLSWGYVPAPFTIYRSLRKLPPAHFGVVDLRNGIPEISIERYWDLQYTPKLWISEYDACDGIREKLRDAVHRRLISDVPLGAFLSGGIDSSIVVGLMAQLSSAPVKTFTIGFSDRQFDETLHARRVAQKWGTDHHEFVVEPDAVGALPKLARHFGEPYADYSAVPTYYVSRETRTGVTVALNGDGGDELFAGYDRYFAIQASERVRDLPLGQPVSRFLAGVLPRGSADGPIRRAQGFFHGVSLPAPQRYARWMNYFREEDKRELFQPDFYASIRESRTPDWAESLFAGAGNMQAGEKAMRADLLLSYLPNDLLPKVDITAMANSLEPRSPFLDDQLMEFVARLRLRNKLRGRRTKHLLKRAFAPELPRENVERPKSGFTLPLASWLRGPLRPMLADLLGSPDCLAAKYIQFPRIAALVTEHLTGRDDHTFVLWSLLMLEMWEREVFTAPRPRVAERAGA